MKGQGAFDLVVLVRGRCRRRVTLPSLLQVRVQREDHEQLVLDHPFEGKKTRVVHETIESGEVACVVDGLHHPAAVAVLAGVTPGLVGQQRTEGVTRPADVPQT